MAMEKKSKGGKGIDDNPSLPEFKERRGGYTEPKPVTSAEAQWLGISKSPKNIQDKYKIERIYTKTEKGEKVTIFDISISSGTGSVKMESHVIPFVGNEYLYFSVEDDKKIPFIRDSKQKSNSQVVDRVVPKNDQAEKNVEGKLDEKKLTAIDVVMRAGKLSYRDDTTSPAKDVFLGEKDVLVAGKEKGQRYILVIEVFDKYEKTGDGSIKPLTRTVRGWVNKNAINKEIEKQEKVGAAGASSAAPGPTSPESDETIFNREYASAISAYNIGKEALYTATSKDAETVVAAHYTNWLKVKYMEATKKIAPISFTKEDLEAVLNKVRATAPKAIVEEKKEEGIVSPYVENLDSIKDEKLSDIVLQNNEGEIRTGKIEIAKLPKENTGADLGAGIKIEINNSKLQGILLARDGDYVFRAMQSRMFVLAKVGELYVPFYISSSGTSGKTEGKWYPFFGYTGSWVVKGEVKENGEMEYSSKISEVQDLLNENFKIPVKYIDLDGEIGIGDKYLNDKKKDEKGNYIVALNPKRKVIFDIKNAVKYKSWFLENKSKELSGLEEESNEIAWVQEKTGLYPTKVFNDGNGSADNWIASIVSLVEGGKKNTEPVKKEDPAQVLSSENKTEPVIEKTVVDSSLDDMTFLDKVDYIGRQIWSEQIKVPLPEFEVIILESEEEKKQLSLIQSWDLNITIKEMEEMVANKTDEAINIGIELLQRDIQKLKDFRDKREAVKIAYLSKQLEMYPDVPENFSTMTLEEKKADIERRRREKIESLPSEVSYLSPNINALKRGIKGGVHTSTEKTEEMSDPEKLEYLFTNPEEFIADAIKKGTYAESKIKILEKELEIIKKINAKYDAEFAALEDNQSKKQKTENKSSEVVKDTIEIEKQILENITVEDYIGSNSRLTEFGMKRARENAEESIAEARQQAELAFRYLRGEISAQEMLTTHPYNYTEDWAKSDEAYKKESADGEAKYWKNKLEGLIK